MYSYIHQKQTKRLVEMRWGKVDYFNNKATRVLLISGSGPNIVVSMARTTEDESSFATHQFFLQTVYTTQKCRVLHTMGTNSQSNDSTFS